MDNKRTESHRARAGATRTHVRGKITESLITREKVEQRARELAMIAGRKSTQITPADWAKALRELQGRIHPPPGANDEPGIAASGLGAPPTSRGRRKPRHGPDDGQLSEDLVQEGLSNAEHDQMVAARKARK
jgi:hypothetical protein